MRVQSYEFSRMRAQFLLFLCGVLLYCDQKSFLKTILTEIFLYQIEEKTEDEDNENLTIKKSIKVARRKQKKDEKAKGRHSSAKPRSSKVSRDKSHVRIEGEDITSALDGSEDKAESQFDADLILRASLYGVLFQSYVDLVSIKLWSSDAIFHPKFDQHLFMTDIQRPRQKLALILQCCGCGCGCGCGCCCCCCCCC